jgi:CRISPR-associated protein Csb2
MLRAIIATWYTKGEGVEPEILLSIIEKLSAPPEFYLPPATIASTCHFMPLYRTPIDEKTANIYDAFAHVGDGRLRVIWRDVILDGKEKDSLNQLLARMGYLGRAESWTEARIVDTDEPKANCVLSARGLPGKGEVVPTMCCVPPSDYAVWREKMIAALTAQKLDERLVKTKMSGKAVTGLTAKEKMEVDAVVPATLFEALQADTTDLKGAGWDRPPGSIWIDYNLPDDAFRTRPVKSIVGRTLPTVARYKIRSKVPWMIFDAIVLGEMIHKKLVWLSNGSSTFTGCDVSGQPLKGDHSMILSHGIASQIKGMRITDLTIFNKDGFAPEDEAALRSLGDLGVGRGDGRIIANQGERSGEHYLRKKDVEKEIEIVLIDIGGPATFGSEDGIMARSSTWTSVTPFVPTRCPKYTRTGQPKMDERGQHIGSAEHDLRRLLEAEGYPRVKNIIPISRATVGGSNRSWLSFRRKRTSSERDPLNEAGFGFEIEFEEPIEGPLAMGYGRNFGLGLFRPGR